MLFPLSAQFNVHSKSPFGRHPITSFIRVSEHLRQLEIFAYHRNCVGGVRSGCLLRQHWLSVFRYRFKKKKENVCYCAAAAVFISSAATAAVHTENIVRERIRYQHRCRSYSRRIMQEKHVYSIGYVKFTSSR